MDLFDISSIKEFINDRIKEKNKEYKKNCYYNEFFTPFELIEKMVSHIPPDLWNPYSKWFEPTCGEGFFMMVIFNKLFHHNSHKHIPIEERKRHIMSNLFLNDINPSNIERVTEIFDGANITTNDFLEWNITTKYDIIIGNPPFQSPSSNYFNTIRKGSKIYEKITGKCLSLLAERGHLCFITPSNIWSGKGLKPGLYETIIHNYSVKYIFLNNLKKRWFPHIGQNLKMCFFVIKSLDGPNKPNESNGSSDTLIENKNGDIFSVVLKDTTNPVEDWTKENALLLDQFLSVRTNYFYRTTEHEKITEGLYESKEEISSEFIESRPCILQNLNRIFFVDTVPEKMIYMPGVEKYILFRMKPFSSGIHDKNGKYYLSSQIYFLPLIQFTKEEKETLIRFFKSETYHKIMRLTSTSQFIKGGVIECLNIPYILNSKF